MAEEYKVLHPVKYYRDYLNHNIRPDGREFDKFRPITLNLSSISSSDGSAIVKIGKTTVICGIKAELCQPKAESPNDGFIIPNVELPPLCSPKFRPGPPSEQAQVATQLVADILKNSKCIDLKTLCIYPDKLVWCLYLDLICLDYDGCLIDACMLATMAALRSTTLPVIDYDAALDNKQTNLEERKSLVMDDIATSTTFIKFDGKILIDPTIEEEDLSSSSLLVVVKNDELCFVHKSGGTPLTDEELAQCIEDSIKRSTILQGIVDTAVNKS